MPFEVRLSDVARSDLAEIGQYIVRNESLSRAEYVLDQLEQRLDSLSELPNRGPYVRELLSMGVENFREVHVRPFRIIYEVSDGVVDVHLIADGRRDMRTLLMRRLLQA